MKRWKVILAAALIFGMGVATGVLSARWAPQSRTDSRESRIPFGFLDARYDLLGKMKSELKLSPEQAERMEAVLQDGRKRTKAVWDTFQPAWREETKAVHVRMTAILNPEQQAKWDQMFKRSRRGPRPDGGDSRNGWKREDRGTNSASGVGFKKTSGSGATNAPRPSVPAASPPEPPATRPTNP